MHRIPTSWIMIFIGLALLAVLLFIPIQFNPKMDKPIQREAQVSIVDEAGKQKANFYVELADTEEEREIGLMGRRALKKKEGMLFIMEEEEVHSFWMLDTYLALDIVFVNAAQEVVYIAKEMEPESQDPVNSKAPCLFALEINAGLSETLGLRVGDRIKMEKLK